MILDGPRCAGKTTTGKRLVARLQELGWNAVYFKKGLPDPTNEYVNMRNHLVKFRQETLSGQVDVFVVDRFVATELVMGLYTGRTLPERLIPYCIEIAQQISDEFLGLQSIMLPPLDVITERMTARDISHTWDMDPSRIHGLWSLAHRILPGASMQLDHSEDVHLNYLQWLVIPMAKPSTYRQDPRYADSPGWLAGER